MAYNWRKNVEINQNEPLCEFMVMPRTYVIAGVARQRIRKLKEAHGNTTLSEIASAMFVATSLDEPLTQTRTLKYRRAVRRDGEEVQGLHVPLPVLDRVKLHVDAAGIQGLKMTRAEFVGIAIMAAPQNSDALGQLVEAYRQIKVGDYDPVAASPISAT